MTVATRVVTISNFSNRKEAISPFKRYFYALKQYICVKKLMLKLFIPTNVISNCSFKDFNRSNRPEVGIFNRKQESSCSSWSSSCFLVFLIAFLVEFLFFTFLFSLINSHLRPILRVKKECIYILD